MSFPTESSADYPKLFRLERSRLLDLLRTVRESEWSKPTPCPGWNVLALCTHLLGGDLGVLARGRDNHRGTAPPPGQSESEFIGWLDDLQDHWVHAARRISPRLVVDLLDWTGPQLAEMFAGQDPTASTATVSWAGPEAVSVWLDQARELSEYWIHRQQLLEGLGRPIDMRPDLLAPVLDGLRWAYPYRLSSVEASDGDAVVIEIAGPVEVTWYLVRNDARWGFEERARATRASIRMSSDQAWRLLTNNLDSVERTAIVTAGEPDLLTTMLLTRAIIGTPEE